MENNRYQHSKIYKLVDNTNDKCYIGSTTTTTLATRLAQHRNDYTRWKSGKRNRVTSFEILENNNYSIILIEDYPCERRDQLLARERYWIETTECVNRCIPTRTTKEWVKDNYDEHLSNQREYHAKNRESDNEKMKLYYESHKEEFKEYNQKYRESHKEQQKEYMKQYYQNNKDKWKRK